MMHTHSTDGARAMTQYTALGLLMTIWAMGAASTVIQKKLMRPRIRKVIKATRKVRWTWLWRPRALASEMVLDRATGRPAVEMVRKKL